LALLEYYLFNIKKLNFIEKFAITILQVNVISIEIVMVNRKTPDSISKK